MPLQACLCRQSVLLCLAEARLTQRSGPAVPDPPCATDISAEKRSHATGVTLTSRRPRAHVGPGIRARGRPARCRGWGIVVVGASHAAGTDPGDCQTGEWRECGYIWLPGVASTYLLSLHVYVQPPGTHACSKTTSNRPGTDIRLVQGPVDVASMDGPRLWAAPLYATARFRGAYLPTGPAGGHR